MYHLTDLAKATQDEKLRVAARAQLRHDVYAAGRQRNRTGSAARLARLRFARVRRERTAAQAY